MSTILRSLFLAVVVWLWCCTIECGAVGVPVLVFPPTAPTRVQVGFIAIDKLKRIPLVFVRKNNYYITVFVDRDGNRHSGRSAR